MPGHLHKSIPSRPERGAPEDTNLIGQTRAHYRPEVLFDGGWSLSQRTAASYYMVNFSAMPDGRFLMVKNDPEAVPTRVNLIFNWFEALRAKVPVK